MLILKPGKETRLIFSSGAAEGKESGDRQHSTHTLKCVRVSAASEPCLAHELKFHASQVPSQTRKLLCAFWAEMMQTIGCSEKHQRGQKVGSRHDLQKWPQEQMFPGGEPSQRTGLREADLAALEFKNTAPQLCQPPGRIHREPMRKKRGEQTEIFQPEVNHAEVLASNHFKQSRLSCRVSPCVIDPPQDRIRRVSSVRRLSEGGREVVRPQEGKKGAALPGGLHRSAGSLPLTCTSAERSPSIPAYTNDDS